MALSISSLIAVKSPPSSDSANRANLCQVQTLLLLVTGLWCHTAVKLRPAEICPAPTSKRVVPPKLSFSRAAASSTGTPEDALGGLGFRQQIKLRCSEQCTEVKMAN